MKTMILLVVALAAVGCKKKDDKAGDGTSAAKGGESDDFEPVQIVADAAIVEAAAPKGWKKTPLGATEVTFTNPKSILGSSITVSATCGGDCSKLADNMKGIAAAMAKAQKSAGWEATVTKTTELPNGIEVDMDVIKPNERPMYQTVRFLHDPKLPIAAQCIALGYGTTAAADRDRLKSGCAKLTLKAK